MDRETFFARLTNEAATPDAKFIKALRKQVIKSAGGDGFISGNPTVVAVTVVSTAVAGIVGYAIFSQSNPAPSSSTEVGITEQADLQDSTAAPSDSSSQRATDTSEDETIDEDSPEAEDSNQSNGSDQVNNSVDPDVSTPATPSSPDPTPPTPEDVPFTVKFWNYPKGATPVIQDDTPDYITTVGHRLDFDWGPESPHASIGSDLFVAQATATKYLDPGDYVINLNVNDGVRVLVNGVEVYERWAQYGGETDKAEFSVGSDPKTVIVIEYFEQTGEAVLKAEVVAL